MASAKEYTILGSPQVQINYTEGEENTNPLLAAVLVLAAKLNNPKQPGMADLTSETLNATGWGLLCALAGCDDLDLPVMGSEFAISGTLDVVSYDNTSYLELL